MVAPNNPINATGFSNPAINSDGRRSLELLHLPLDIIKIIFLRYLENDMRVVCKFVCKSIKNVILLGTVSPEDLCIEAASHGYLGVLKWARANGVPWNERVFSSAARGGHLEVLKWMRENGAPGSPSD